MWIHHFEDADEGWEERVNLVAGRIGDGEDRLISGLLFRFEIRSNLVVRKSA